ncbi:hypothetical protein [uncultured Fenollaria sp.]|uniref:hypothetical protein n=1 Tax=uncultured Fenollaria sp. TaxID=1686315 RepID=UPI0025D46AC2|nr:hypothetical protein [uncultured Fenollaria sp.]
MFVDITFMSKVDKIDKNKLVKDFKGKVDFKDNQLICDEFIFNYEFKKSINDSIIRLKVSTIKGTNTYDEAKSLCYLKDQIRQGEHRKDYNIIIDYDGSSEYYCNKLSPFISRFERKLRQCIYLITLAAYGNEWVQKTIFANVLKEVTEKENNKNRHVEMALECFTFNNYIEYLFNTREEYNAVKIIEEAKFEVNKSESEKKDVLSILNKYKVISLWEKLFDTYDDIEFLETDIKDIKNKRNNVLHHKEMSDSDFIDYKKVFIKSNKKLDCAIRRIEDEKYNDNVNVVDVLYSFNESIKSIVGLSIDLMKTMAPVMEELREISKGIASCIQGQQFSDNINLALKNSLADTPTIAYKNNLSSAIEFQKSLSGIIPESNLNEQLKQAATTSIPKHLIQPLKLAHSIPKISYPDNIKSLLEAIENNQILNDKFDEIDKLNENISEEEDK